MNKKPDVLLLLAIVFGLGVIASALTHGGNDTRADQARVVVSSDMQALRSSQ